MSRINYPLQSPYGTTPQLNWRLGRYVHRPIASDSSDSQQTILVRYQERPQLYSLDFYGTPSYWFVFWLRNPDQINDPITGFTAGLSIWVPTLTRLKALGY